VDEFVGALAEQQRELRDLLDGLTPADWERPSRCDGWTAGDVVLHVAQTNEMAIASAEGRFAEFLTDMGRNMAAAADVDEGADRMVEKERGLSPDALRARYRTGADTLLRLFEAGDPHERVQWVAGELSLRTLTTTRLAETWIHTGDVADAVGRPLVPGERLRHIARLAWRTLPYAFRRAGRSLLGPVAFELRGPDGDEWRFVPDEPAVTTIRGDGVELCLVAARRVAPANTGLVGEGPDADAVLELVRTYA
jgi:uncharacterized protein (TIGR03084 family)